MRRALRVQPLIHPLIQPLIQTRRAVDVLGITV